MKIKYMKRQLCLLMILILSLVIAGCNTEENDTNVPNETVSDEEVTSNSSADKEETKNQTQAESNDHTQLIDELDLKELEQGVEYGALWKEEEAEFHTVICNPSTNGNFIVAQGEVYNLGVQFYYDGDEVDLVQSGVELQEHEGYQIYGANKDQLDGLEVRDDGKVISGAIDLHLYLHGVPDEQAVPFVFHLDCGDI